MQFEKTCQPFSINLRDVQHDVDDINRILIRPTQKLLKTAKHCKNTWRVLSWGEHITGITFGILAITNVSKRETFLSLSYALGMCTTAKLGFEANKNFCIYKTQAEKLQQILNTSTDFLKVASAQDIKIAADILRQRSKDQERQ